VTVLVLAGMLWFGMTSVVIDTVENVETVVKVDPRWSVEVNVIVVIVAVGGVAKTVVVDTVVTRRVETDTEGTNTVETDRLGTVTTFWTLMNVRDKSELGCKNPDEKL
jgi:hypothetical protein